MKKLKMLISYLLTALVLLSLAPTVFAAELEPYIISDAENVMSTGFDWDTGKYPASLTTATAFNTRVALCQEWGFTYGAVIGSGRSLDRVSGLGGKDTADTSVQITGNSSNVDIYFEKEFNGGSGYTGGVFTLKFKLYSDSAQYLKLRSNMSGSNKDIWIRASENAWSEHSFVIDLDNAKGYLDSQTDAIDMGTDTLKRFRFIFCPSDGKTIAFDDLSITYSKRGTESITDKSVSLRGTAKKGSTVSVYVNDVFSNSVVVQGREYIVTADNLRAGDNSVKIEVQSPGGEVSEYTKVINLEKEMTISPSDGESISTLPRCFNAVCQDAETIVFELDGKFLGDADASGNVRVPQNLDYGRHTIKAIAIFADGSSCVKEVEFRYYQKVSFNKSVENFDTIPDITADDTAQIQSSLKNDYNWVYYTGQSSVSRIPGSASNGNDGDYALYVEKKVETGNAEARLVFDEGKETVYTTNGKIELNFDLMLTDPSQQFRCFFYPRWVDSYVLIQDGKLVGTNVDFPANKWVKINMEYDLSNAGGDIAAGVWTVRFTIDGETTVVVDAVDAIPYQYLSGTRITFSMYSGASTESKPIAMAIDNFSLTANYYGIEKCNYVRGGEEKETTSKVPCDAEQIKLYLNEELEDITGSDVTLITDGGVSVPVSDVRYNSAEKTVEIEPASTLPGNTGISVKLSSDLSFAGGEKFGKSHFIRFITDYETLKIDASFKKGTSALYTAKQVKKGDIISADVSVKNISTIEQNVTFVLSLRNNKKLVSMVSETIHILPDDSSTITLSLPQIQEDGDYTLYLMNMDSLSNGLYIEDYMEIK